MPKLITMKNCPYCEGSFEIDARCVVVVMDMTSGCISTAVICRVCQNYINRTLAIEKALVLIDKGCPIDVEVGSV